MDQDIFIKMLLVGPGYLLGLVFILAAAGIYRRGESARLKQNEAGAFEPEPLKGKTARRQAVSFLFFGVVIWVVTTAIWVYGL